MGRAPKRKGARRSGRRGGGKRGRQHRERIWFGEREAGEVRSFTCWACVGQEGAEHVPECRSSSGPPGAPEGRGRDARKGDRPGPRGKGGGEGV